MSAEPAPPLRFAGDYLLSLEYAFFIQFKVLCRTSSRYRTQLAHELDDLLTGELPTPGVRFNLQRLRNEIDQP